MVSELDLRCAPFMDDVQEEAALFCLALYRIVEARYIATVVQLRRRDAKLSLMKRYQQQLVDVLLTQGPEC